MCISQHSVSYKLEITNIIIFILIGNTIDKRPNNNNNIFTGVLETTDQSPRQGMRSLRIFLLISCFFVGIGWAGHEQKRRLVFSSSLFSLALTLSSFN